MRRCRAHARDVGLLTTSAQRVIVARRGRALAAGARALWAPRGRLAGTIRGSPTDAAELTPHTTRSPSRDETARCSARRVADVDEGVRLANACAGLGASA